jgi:hypothetical protein
LLKLKMPMYSFKVKADASDIEIPTVRSLLVFAAIIIAIYRNNHIYSLNIAVCITLLIVAFLAEILLVKYRLHSLLVISIAAVLLAVCTYNIIFPIIMLIVALTTRYFYVPPVVEAKEEGISIKKTFSNKLYPWAFFNAVILKDDLLTLDFKNNTVLQLEVENSINEIGFNDFCINKLV